MLSSQSSSLLRNPLLIYDLFMYVFLSFVIFLQFYNEQA